MKAKKISINYKPLQISGGIEVVGSVPSIQTYSADTKEYSPDYTLTPLVLFPRCHAVDSELLVINGDINASLTNLRWFEQFGETKVQITTTNPDYQITQSGSEKGMIKIKKNMSITSPTSYFFIADYVDPRTYQIYTFQYSIVIRCQDATPAEPSLLIDSPDTVYWNPLRDLSTHVINATLLVADSDVTSEESCNIFYYRSLSNGSLDLITSLGGEVTSKSKNSMTVDLTKIGRSRSYIIKSTYSATSSPGDTPSDKSPVKTTTIVKRIPTIECDWEGPNSGVPAGTTHLYPKVIITDSLGIVPNSVAELWLNPIWKVKQDGDSEYEVVAEGYDPVIEFSDNMMLSVEIVEK